LNKFLIVESFHLWSMSYENGEAGFEDDFDDEIEDLDETDD
jgi:hypothetical protein